MPRTRSLAWAELKIGIVTLAAIAIALTLLFTLGGQGGFFWQRYHLKTKFPNVYGLKEGALVRVAGVEVGKVSGVDFIGSEVEIVLEINESMRERIRSGSRASIGSLGLLGEATVEVTASLEGQPLKEWDYIPQGRGAGQISDAADAATRGLDEVTALVRDIRQGRGTVGKLFAEDELYTEIRSFVAATDRVVSGLERGQGTAGKLLKDPAAFDALKKSLDGLQQITARLNAGEGSLGRLLNDDALARSLSSASANVDTLTQRLNRGEGTAGKLLTDTALYERLTSLAQRVEQLTARLEKGEGTAGLLLQDRKLYDNLNGAVSEMKALLADVRKDPRKYLQVRVSIF